MNKSSLASPQQCSCRPEISLIILKILSETMSDAAEDLFFGTYVKNRLLHG